MHETELGGKRRSFAPTRWTLVLAARRSPLALEELIAAYWKPLYFFIRRQGRGVEDAKDLTQGFIAQLLERKSLDTVDRAKGKFRTFLLAALENFLSNEHDRACARKRRPTFDFTVAETQFRAQHSFERDWALAVLERAFARLKREDPRLAQVAGVIRGSEVPYSELAGQLQTSQGNVKVLVHRARRRLREFLLEELACIVDPPGDLQGELADLMKAVSCT